MANKCVICGKEFEPYHTYGERQKCCSQECRKKYIKLHQNDYYKNLSAEQRKAYALKQKKKNNGKVKCRICGLPVYRELYFGAPVPQMHEECVVKDAMKTLIAGEHITRAQYSRLQSRGYTITELRERIREMRNDAFCNKSRAKDKEKQSADYIL